MEKFSGRTDTRSNPEQHAIQPRKRDSTREVKGTTRRADAFRPLNEGNATREASNQVGAIARLPSWNKDAYDRSREEEDQRHFNSPKRYRVKCFKLSPRGANKTFSRKGSFCKKRRFFRPFCLQIGIFDRDARRRALHGARRFVTNLAVGAATRGANKNTRKNARVWRFLENSLTIVAPNRYFSSHFEPPPLSSDV